MFQSDRQLKAKVPSLPLLLPSLQSAYRRGHSTETALAKVYSDFVSSLDSRVDNQSVLAVLDSV